MKKYIAIFDNTHFCEIPKVGNCFRLGMNVGYCIFNFRKWSVMFNKKGIR